MDSFDSNDFPTDPAEYLVKESTMKLGKVLEMVAQVKEDLEQVNVENIYEREPRALPALHDSLEKLVVGANNFLLASTILKILSERTQK